MTNDAYPVLCGGTFFTLILQARQERSAKRAQRRGDRDGLSDPDTLSGLLKVMCPDFKALSSVYTFKTNVSEYKTCKNEGSNLPFLHQQEVSVFDTRVKNDYRAALAAMVAFVYQFLEVGTSTHKEIWLVKALIDLIEKDQSIPETDAFYVCQNGTAMTKAVLCSSADICFQPFLLGVWHFVLVNRQEKNMLGKATYDKWCPANGNKARRYGGTMGDGVTWVTNVSVLVDAGMSAESDQIDDEQPIEYGEPHAERMSDSPQEKATTQVVNNPVVFNQYGNNNTQVGSIDTLTIINS